MNKEFIVASNNEKKIKELERILKPLGIIPVTAGSAGIDMSGVEESGSTFEENAYIKAKAAFDASGKPSIADDSGLCVDALNGAPGVYSARYAGENASDKDKYEKLLKELDGVPKEKRTARFVCAICCIIDENSIIKARGECVGIISTLPMGEGGFGYDPVFLLDNGKSFAQISSDEKDEISHRGKALRNLLKALSEKIKDGNNDNK